MAFRLAEAPISRPSSHPFSVCLKQSSLQELSAPWFIGAR